MANLIVFSIMVILRFLPSEAKGFQNLGWKNRKFGVETHPCERRCTTGESMTCSYTFQIESYSTLSSIDCGGCTMQPDVPYNFTDCRRPHCVTADGWTRTVSVVNRQLPGPTISVCEGDTVEVEVHNFLGNGEGATVHWHGLYQNGSQWMDGVPMVTQCPINQFDAMQYRFQAYPAGTHWWHSHVGFQHPDGVSGAFIVRRPDDPVARYYDVDDIDHVVFLTDWLHVPMIQHYLLPGNANGVTLQNNLLINGVGLRVGGDFDQYLRDPIPERLTPISEFVVEKGKRYRFRLISSAFEFCPIEVSVDGHYLYAIATDGAEIRPIKVTTITVHDAERYDFVLNASAKPGNYWLRAKGLADCAGREQRAVVKYSKSVEPSAIPSVPLPPGGNLNPLYGSRGGGRNIYPVQMRSLREVPGVYRRQADVVTFQEIRITMTTNAIINRRVDEDLYPIAVPFLPQMNNRTFWWPSQPLLYQMDTFNQNVICKDGQDYTNGTMVTPCVNIIKVPRDKLVDIVLYDGDSFNVSHPFHLHGQRFAVVDMAQVNKNGAPLHQDQIRKIYAARKSRFVTRSPVMKDVLQLPFGGYAVLRIFTDNPGFWAFHCHISSHLVGGMFSILQVGDDRDITRVPDDFARCGDYPPRRRKNGTPSLDGAEQGSWSSWAGASDCSATCGIGWRRWDRRCLNASGCRGEGLSAKFEACQLRECSRWASWGAWSKCERMCSPGARVRSRVCVLGDDCPGPSIEAAACPCPSNCLNLSDKFGPSFCQFYLGALKKESMCLVDSNLIRGCNRTCCLSRSWLAADRESEV